LVAIFVLILLMSGGIFWISTHKADKPQQAASATSGGAPDIKVTDFSQGASANEKTAVLVEHSDSTFEKFILDNAMVDSYVKGLPPGEKVVSKTPMNQ
jgi:hypothetical protein